MFKDTDNTDSHVMNSESDQKNTRLRKGNILLYHMTHCGSEETLKVLSTAVMLY